MTAKIKINISDLTPQFIEGIKERYASRKVEIQVSPETDEKRLDEATFWDIIHQLNWSKKDNDEAILSPAVSKLADYPLRTIFQFQDLLSKKLYLLDQKKYAKHIGEDAWQESKYFSVDQFLYARCCVVANGKEAFEIVLANPSMMPKNLTFEPLLHLAADAYKMKVGKRFNYVHMYNYETYSNQEGWSS
ncbi:MAG: DUF4240 domain-containing protein [Bacteroidota bacterium]